MYSTQSHLGICEWLSDPYTLLVPEEAANPRPMYEEPNVGCCKRKVTMK